MRSISSKLIVAFLSIGVVSLLIIGLTAVWSTRAEFIRFLSDQTQVDMTSRLAEYHRVYGSWDRVETIFGERSTAGGPGMQPGYQMRRLPFALANEKGRIVIPAGPYRRGERLSPTDLNSAIPIEENGEVVGLLIPVRTSFEGAPRELEFIRRINRLLLFGGLAGAVIALLLGVFLSRSLTRPIRELTEATHAVSQGDLSQQVPVRSTDELGELAQAFNRMSSELRRSVDARRQMTADIAHELRTPLSLILGHAEAVHDGVLPPSSENFELIRDEAIRLEQLVDDLRLLSLADAGELSFSIQSIAPARLLEDVASAFQLQARQKQVSLVLDASLDLPAVEVDPGRMRQVLTNILDNALRHTPEGGRIQLTASENAGRVRIVVQDSGPGLQVEEVRRIFDRFYRADASRQREEHGHGGSGLGLAIARSIVQAHGGQLSAESEPGNGLRVLISLPVKPG